MTAPGLPVIVATNGRGLPVTVLTNGRGLPIQTSINGFGIPIVIVTAGGLPVQYVAAPAPPTNILTGLPWIAGAATTLSLVAGYERGTGATNPRLFKHPTTLTIGLTYRLLGNARPENGGTCFLRVSTTNALSADGPVNFSFAAQTLIDMTFVAARTDYYIGVVIISDVNNGYVEIEDTFSLTLI